MGGFDPGGGVTADIHNSVHAGHKMPQDSRIAAPPMADSPDGVPETAPELTPEITPTPAAPHTAKEANPQRRDNPQASQSTLLASKLRSS
jgi:hypothetical protein